MSRKITSRDVYHLSQRGAANFADRDIWGPREKSMGNPWSKSNPTGMIILRLAENSLMHNEVGEFIRAHMEISPIEHLTYSTGPRGSRRLRRAAAAFLNDRFEARTPVTYENIIVTPGCASALDAISFSICDEGDGILVPQPLYNGFNFDLANRSNVKVVGVKYEEIDEYTGFDDLFQPKVNRSALEAALSQANQDGIKIRALLISNPHNPLGRCYPPETLKEFAAFCEENTLHFVSDEIYALSVFQNSEIPSAPLFTSVLSLELESIIDPCRVHVLYGASKDFGANGLRIGFVCSKNEGIIGSISSIGIFSWSPHVLQDVWAAMLEDRQWIENFMFQKTSLMLDRYNTITAFLSKHGIPYLDMNAGLFLWVDLRHLLTSKTVVRHSDYTSLKTTSPDSQFNLQAELRIAEICIENGVMIAPGHVYMAEEYGWFRVTFTVGDDALKEGLRRLLKSIEEIESRSEQWKRCDIAT